MHSNTFYLRDQVFWKRVTLKICHGIVRVDIHHTIEVYIPATQGCRLWMCEAPDDHALLVHSDGTYVGYTSPEFYYPDKFKDRGTMCSSNLREEDQFKAIDIREGESAIAACPGEKYKNSEEDLSQNKLKKFQTFSITLTCRNDRLLNNDIDIDWSDLVCSRTPFPSVIINDMDCGNQQGHIITIGWNIDYNIFITQMEICFEKKKQTTLYEHHLLHGRYIDAKAVDPLPRRPSFKRGKVYSTNIDNLYKNNKYSYNNAPDKNNYLARGHLAPDADFVYKAEQNGTFYYANAVPQWQGFNAGNWLKLESATRDLAEESEATLSIWTGTHGELNLPDDQDNTLPFYLGLLENQNILPVPEIMWKVVHNPMDNQPIVFIGLNDIRESNDNDFNGLCQDICSQITWVKFDYDKRKGKMICCSLQDAKRAIPTLPELDDRNVLRDEL